ncbi:MAG TPA: adenylate/guanylate cyclase domain-containing protein [Flavisolibacter sp.]|nr:adenylate/guanylate cyclase domain-containing protein [Flavisolibacter sp.]
MATPENTGPSYFIEFIGDQTVPIREGQTILDASLEAGIPHYHACGGQGQCTTCRVHINNGGKFLSELSKREIWLRKSIPFGPHVRLACQTYVSGPVSLHRMIRDEADMTMYLAEDRQNDLQNTGREQELALFFLDIRNFTPFMERFLPFDVIHIVRRLFCLFRNAIDNHHGTIIETAGDGFYAVFGFETSVQQAANDAYAAAQEILAELEEFNRTYVEKHFFHRFQAGIGLHTGKVIVGNIGIGVNNNLTVMGLPVNVASRIQAATRTLNNSLVVSEQLGEHLDPKPACQRVQTQLKGLTDTYELLLCGEPFYV